MLAILSLTATSVNAQLIGRVRKEIISDSATGDQVITHIADGGGWSTSITLNNLDANTPATVTILFWGDSGNQQAFPFVGMGLANYVTGTIPPMGQATVQTANIYKSTTTGSAFINTTGHVGGFAVFGYVTGQEAVVPIEAANDQKFILAFDNTNGHVMGIALANPHANLVTANVAFLDENGGVILSDRLTMPANSHTSFILTDRYPGLAGVMGTALFTTDSPANGIAGLGIRANSAGAYTTVFALALP